MQDLVPVCCCRALKLGSLCILVASFVVFLELPGEEVWQHPRFDNETVALAPRPFLRPGNSGSPAQMNQTAAPQPTTAREVGKNGTWETSTGEGHDGSDEDTSESEHGYNESSGALLDGDQAPDDEEDEWEAEEDEWEARDPASYTPAELKERAAGSWIQNLRYRERKIYSQQGEDGVIIAIMEAMPVVSKYYVEFGVEAGTERNTRALQEKFGWTGLLLDGSHHDDRINLHEEFITAEGIVGLFQKHKVPLRFGLLSVDIDSYDWWVLKSILEAGYRPDVIVTEVNTQVERGLFTIAPASVTGAKRISPDSFAFGATPEAFAALQAAYGYVMIYCERAGVNCFAVRRGNLTAKYLPDPDKGLHPPPMYTGMLACRKQKEDNMLPWYEIAPDLSVKRTAVYPRPCEECRLDHEEP